MIQKEKNLLEKLLEDTFKDSEINIESHGPRSFSLQKDNGLKDSLQIHPICLNFTKIMESLTIVKSYKGTNSEDPPCFRIYLNDIILDFPKNWSYFQEWDQRIKTGEEDLCLYFTKQNDQDALIPAFKKIYPINWDAILFYCEDQNFYLFFVKNHSET